MHEETERMGEELGIRFDFARARRGNTFDAHRVLHMARDVGRQREVLEQLLSAYFTDGVPIGDRAALAASAALAGMDEDAVRAMLDGDAYTSAVRDDEQEAVMLGITAVPFFVIDRRYGLPGAHPPETIRAAIDRAREERARPAAS